MRSQNFVYYTNKHCEILVSCSDEERNCMPYTFTGLNKNFDHMDLDIDLLISKINVQPLSCDFQKQNPFPFLNPDIYDIRNPA